MKKLVLASLVALAGFGFASAPTLRAQDSITIKDPAEFNAYQNATSQSDPSAKATGLETFLKNYPQSVVKKAVLDMLVDTYQGMGHADDALSAATRLLQVDPNNMKAIFLSVVIKKSQCGKTADAQTCDDAAALALKGLSVPKDPATADDVWKKLTGATYPIFHSAIALDDAISKKDFKAAVSEYRTELMLYPAEQTQSGPGLVDTLQLAEAYTKPESKDLVQAVWFYARAWNFAPAAYKAQIEPKLEYYYKKYHGALDGLDGIKTQAAATLFPPGTFIIPPAPTPADIVHKLMVETPDLTTLNLGDKEYVLANGAKEDADKLWAVMKDKATPVPGTVMETAIGAIKVVVTQGVKPADFVVNLKTPMAAKDIPQAGSDLATQKAFILSSGAASDTEKLATIFSEEAKPVTKIVIDPLVSVIKMAVTQDAKDASIADFIVNLKTPLADKEAPAKGFEFGLQSKGQAELDGTYDSYTQVPATATMAQTAQIVLREGLVQAEKKKPVPVRKPPAGRRPAAH